MRITEIKVDISHTDLENQLLSLRQEVINEIKPTKIDLYGYCAVISILIWIKLGKPRNLWPYSVMVGGEEHVILYNKTHDFAFDATCDQFGHNRYFPEYPKDEYDTFLRFSDQDIKFTIDELNELTNQKFTK